MITNTLDYLRADNAIADTRRLMSTEDVADFLSVSVSTLTKWRLTGSGPSFVRLGSRIAYRPIDVETFIQARAFRSTSEYAA
jgi:predicted DNA-binding transcriptional regulator AlpA